MVVTIVLANSANEACITVFLRRHWLLLAPVRILGNGGAEQSPDDRNCDVAKLVPGNRKLKSLLEG